MRVISICVLLIAGGPRVTDTKAIGHSGPSWGPGVERLRAGHQQDPWLESHYGEGVFHPNTDTPLNVINNTGRRNKTGD